MMMPLLFVEEQKDGEPIHDFIEIQESLLICFDNIDIINLIINMST